MNNKPFTFADHTTAHRGVSVEIAGQSLVMPSVLMRRAVELAEMTDELSAGNVSGARYLRLRNEIVEETVRRNYPDVPDTWFDELDAADYMDLTAAATEATNLGGKRAANH